MSFVASEIAPYITGKYNQTQIIYIGKVGLPYKIYVLHVWPIWVDRHTGAGLGSGYIKDLDFSSITAVQTLRQDVVSHCIPYMVPIAGSSFTIVIHLYCTALICVSILPVQVSVLAVEY